METNLFLGFLFVIVGAVCGGSFGLPSKFVKEDTPWENLWGPFFFFVTILIPITLGPMLVKDFYLVYSTAGIAALIVPLIFGFLWGTGSMTLGMSFAFIGLSLAYSLNYGAQIVFGSMGTMLAYKPQEVLTPHGYVIMAGVAVCLLGVVVCGRSGVLKTRSIEQDALETPKTTAKKPKIDSMQNLPKTIRNSLMITTKVSLHSKQTTHPATPQTPAAAAGRVRRARRIAAGFRWGRGHGCKSELTQFDPQTKLRRHHVLSLLFSYL